MQSIQLYLNGQLLNLSDDSPIALSFAINNLAEVKNQQGNTSNQFKVPLTQRNRQILGFPDDIRITNNLPYTQYHARIIQDGIEIIPDGIGEINSADDNTASITVLSGNVDFFDSIDGSIYDMGDKTKPSGANSPFAFYNHTWSLNSAALSQKNTEGYIYPVIDYGNLSNIKPYHIDVRDMRPAFFLKTAIDLIVKQTGYSAAGSLLENEMYSKILIPFANDEFEHGTDYTTQPDNLGMIAYSKIDQAASRPVIIFGSVLFNGDIKFTQVDSDPSMQYDGVKSFVAQQIMTIEVLVTIPRFYMLGRINDTNASNVDIIISYFAAAGGQLDTPLNYNFSNGNFTRVAGTSGGGLMGYHEFGLQKLSAEFDMQVGDRITVRYEFKGDGPARFTMFAGASLQIKTKKDNVLFGQQIQCERIFPDISQKDLLKDNLQRFGIICQTDNTNKTVTFASFKDIVKNIPIARDWTDKCKNVGKTNVFQLGNYAQVNNLKYKKDDAITDGYADDAININDKTLPASVDLFESQFAPTLNTPFVGGFVAQIRKIPEDAEPGDNEFSVSTTPRVLVDQKLNLFNLNESVNFTDGSSNIVINDVISTPYFYKQNGPFNLSWKDKDGSPGLRSLYYAELERILTQTKKVTRYFLLTAADIQALDLLIPVYLEQDNAYFYINKIDQWRKGQVCKVELIKLGEYES